MEYLGNISPDMVKIGIFTIAHLAILVNREIREKLHSPSYDVIALHAEHIVSYATFALGMDGLSHMLGTPDVAVMSAIGRMFWVDYLSKPIARFQRNQKEYKPEWSQLLSDGLGIAAYQFVLKPLL